MDIKEEVKTLREQIEYHSNRYYNMDAPEITDYEYDMLMQRLKQIRNWWTRLLRHKKSVAMPRERQEYWCVTMCQC